MNGGTQSRTGAVPDPEPYRAPEISVRESRPGRSVFLEAGNTDGWVASDLTVEVSR